MDEVGSLIHNSDSIATGVPFAYFETGDDLDIVVSFIVVTEDGITHGIAFDREEDTWRSVYTGVAGEDGDPEEIKQETMNAIARDHVDTGTFPKSARRSIDVQHRDEFRAYFE